MCRSLLYLELPSRSVGVPKSDTPHTCPRRGAEAILTRFRMNSSCLRVQSQLMRYAYQMREQDLLVVPLVIGFLMVPNPPHPLGLSMHAWWLGH